LGKKWLPSQMRMENPVYCILLGESQSPLLGKEKSEKLRSEETGLGVFNSVFPKLMRT